MIGYRLYYSVYEGNPKSGEPPSFQLSLIRNLPSLEEDREINSQLLIFTQFDTSYFSQGMFLSSGSSPQLGNVLFVSSIDTGALMKSQKNNGAIRGNELALAEWSSITNSPDRVWDIKEAPLFDAFLEESLNGFNRLATQVVAPPRSFLILTNHGKDCLFSPPKSQFRRVRFEREAAY